MSSLPGGRAEEPAGQIPVSARGPVMQHGDPVTAPAAERPRAPSHWMQFAMIAAIVVAVDQITKRYVDARLPLGDSWPSEDWPFRFMHVKNTGAAFSILQNQTLFLTVMSLVGLGAILLYFKFRPSDHPLLRVALALQLGGAIGNLLDRIKYGWVTDFLKIPNWPVFNIADCAISIGVVTVIAFLLFAKGDERQSDGRAAAPPA
jgi:signal peptidase II